MADRGTLLRRLATPGAVPASTGGESAAPRCPACGYALTGLTLQARCPECGVDRSEVGGVSPAYLGRLAGGALIAGLSAWATAVWLCALGLALITNATWAQAVAHPVIGSATVLAMSVGLWGFALSEPMGDRVTPRASRWNLVPCGSVAAGLLALAAMAWGARAADWGDCWLLVGGALLCAFIAGLGALSRAAGVLARIGDWQLAGAFNDLVFTIGLTAIVGLALGPMLALAMWGGAMLKFAAKARRAAESA